MGDEGRAMGDEGWNHSGWERRFRVDGIWVPVDKVRIVGRSGCWWRNVRKRACEGKFFSIPALDDLEVDPLYHVQFFDRTHNILWVEGKVPQATAWGE
jgi:hypothetical protein